MNRKTLQNLTFVLILLIAFGGLVWWLMVDPTAKFSESVPGMDNQPADLGSMVAEVEIGQYFTRFDSIESPLTGKWPRFRGVNFDNKSPMHTEVNWNTAGPRIAWSVDLGEGHAAPAIYNGRVYLLDYDEEIRADMLRCFSLEDGRELWRRWYDNPLKRNHGMSRTIPAVNDSFVVTIGPNCHVMCVKTGSGDLLWGKDLVHEFGSEVPMWYTGQCPLLTDSVAVLAPGGTDTLIMGVNCRNGEILWYTPNPDHWGMSHSSIMPVTYQGVNMYIYSAIGGIVGIAADGDSVGQILWKSPAWNPNVIAPSPVFMPDGRLFVTAGYGAGSMLFQLQKVGDAFSLQTLDKYEPKDGLASEQQTPILYNGHLFCILPKDAGPERNQMVCCDPNDLHHFTWTSGKTTRFGLGPFILLDDKFFILSDDGILTVAQADIRQYRQIASAKVLDGHDAWGPIAVADGRLLCRDSKKLVCIQL